MEILKDTKISVAAASQTSAGTTVTGSAIDMSAFDHCVFMAEIGTANAGNYLKVGQGNESDQSDVADLKDSKVVASNDGDLVAIEIKNPTERYLTPYIVRGGANTATGPIIAMQHGGKKQPQDNNVDDVIVSELHVSPSEGTA